MVKETKKCLSNNLKLLDDLSDEGLEMEEAVWVATF